MGVGDVLSTYCDEGYGADQSLLLRYRRVFDTLKLPVATTLEDLEAISVREGARSIFLAEYGGVRIFLNDETTLMTTGTYKDLDACLVLSVARHVGLKRIVASSGGNLAYALARYASTQGIEVFLFHPSSTLYKTQSWDLAEGNLHLYGVSLGEREVKRIARDFATQYGLTIVPDIRLRLAASACRALHMMEAVREHGRFDWFAQVVCAGYGPAGIYNCLSGLTAHEHLDKEDVPKFLAIQQSQNAPMARAWQGGAREIRQQDITANASGYLEPGLYNTNPGRNYTRLFDLMNYFGGEFTEVDRDTFDEYVPRVLELLATAEVELSKRPDADDYLEKAALLTGVGLLKAIDDGTIPKGSSVLYMLTGGYRSMPSDRRVPACEAMVDESKSQEQWIRELGEAAGLRPLERLRSSDRMFPWDIDS